MICRLCLQPRILCRSHVIPEFLYQPAYDSRHRMVELRHGGREVGHLKKGIRHPLLCDDCDGYLNTHFEQPTHREVFAAGLIPTSAPDSPLPLTGLDYAAFKLFHLSILWRAHHADNEMFANVSLGPYAEVIRTMLLSRTPGPADRFQIYGAVVIDTEEKKVLNGLLLQPLAQRLEDQRVYWFLFGGVAWHYVVGRGCIPSLLPYSLSEAGAMTLPVTDFLHIRPFRSFMVDAVRAQSVT